MKRLLAAFIMLCCCFCICFDSRTFAEEITQVEAVEEEVIEEDTEKIVLIYLEYRPAINKGEIIHLTSVLIGFENCHEIIYSWSCDKHDGNGFQPIPDAHSDYYEFIATAETLQWDWQLTVYYR